MLEDCDACRTNFDSKLIDLSQQYIDTYSISFSSIHAFKLKKVNANKSQANHKHLRFESRACLTNMSFCIRSYFRKRRYIGEFTLDSRNTNFMLLLPTFNIVKHIRICFPKTCLIWNGEIDWLWSETDFQS